MSDIHSVLSNQLRIRQLEQKRAVARQVAALIQMRPYFVRHLRYVEDEGDTLWMRALVKEIKRCNATFQSVMGICNLIDFERDAFFEFAQRCSMLAGIDMATSTQDEFFTAYMACKCEDCAMAYKAHALSGIILEVPFPISLLHEICHMGDLAKAHLMEPLWLTLDDLIPEPSRRSSD